VSLSFARRLEIFVAPGRVQVWRRGWRRSAAVSRACAASRLADWRPAIDALGDALAEATPKHAAARVVVSNHFVRYALLPRAVGARRDERDALARHALETVFGSDGQEWAVVAARPGCAADNIAAAVERPFLEALAELLGEWRLRAYAAYPLLAQAYDRCRRRIGSDGGWLVVAEPGRACVGLVRGGAWQALRSQRVAGAVSQALPLLLEHTRLGCGEGDQTLPLYYGAQDDESWSGHELPGWRVDSVAAFA
jgi:hypothetical protein